MAEQTVLDAVNFAIEHDGASPPTEEVELEAAPADDSEGSDGADGADAADAADSEAAAADGDAAAEKDADAEGAEAEAAGQERNPDGTFKTKVDAEAAAAAAAAKPAVEVKKPDALNDPIPKDLKQETQDRIRTLVKTAKESTEKATKFETDFNYLVQGVQATGATPEQYGETLSWLAMFNSGDPAQQMKALELVETVAERLSTKLGKERTISDPLAAHADLSDAVKRGQLTPEYAKEIARTRNSSQFNTELTTAARAQQDQQQKQEQELTTARADLSALETTLQATDPQQYAAKKDILVAALKPVFASIPPSQWKAKFEEAYRALRIPAAVRPKTTGEQPMRANKAPAGGQARAPSSMGEAINAALSSMK